MLESNATTRLTSALAAVVVLAMDTSLSMEAADVVYGVTLLVAFVLLVDRLGLKSVVVGYVLAHMTPQSVDREGAAGKSYELSVSVVGIRGNEQPFVSS